MNPFRGALNIIRYGAAEAVTVDGVEWDIYVNGDELLKGIDESTNIQTSEIRYGHWSAAQGLKHGPIYPSDDFKRMEQLGTAVLEYLKRCHDHVPFPLADHYELWLLDKESQPLCLVDTATFPRELSKYSDINWRPGRVCQAGFNSPHVDSVLSQLHMNSKRHNSDKLEIRMNSAQTLCELLQQEMHETPKAQWILRQQPQAIGLNGYFIEDKLIERRLDNQCFPKFVIREQWASESSSQFVSDYIDWLSPWLLLMQNLDQEERARFEKQAMRHALSAAKQLLLYPQLLDPSLENRVRVEAALRNAKPAADETEDFLSTDYIELSDPDNF